MPARQHSGLLGAARTGDPGAFLELVIPVEQSVYRNALRITCNRPDAEDVRQETMLKAYTRLGQFSGDSDSLANSFSAWLSRIAVNEAIDTLRRRQVRRVISLDGPIPGGNGPDFFRPEPAVADDPEQRYARLELRGILADVIEQLDPSFRRVCLLRDVAQFTTEETAQILGISSAAVRIRLFRARLKLRERLAQVFSRPTRELRSSRPDSSRYLASCRRVFAQVD